MLLNNDIKPFVKWAGGKRGILQTLESLSFIPKDFVNYYEPMVGAGAVFFYIVENYNPAKCIISDINPDLINTYKALKKDNNRFIKEISKIKEDFNNSEKKSDFYYNKRDEFNKLKKDKENHLVYQAALFLFLNKTCYNGLYRVNKKGEFNVPFGQYKKSSIYDENNLRIVSKLLQKTTILNQDFKEAVKNTKEGDFIYFDPPYVPISKTSDFTSYTKTDFDLDDQKRLAKVMNDLSQKRCYVAQSNSYSPDIKQIFSKYNAFILTSIKVPRSISCKANGRKPIKEYLITNYNLKKYQEKLEVIC